MKVGFVVIRAEVPKSLGFICPDLKVRAMDIETSHSGGSIINGLR